MIDPELDFSLAPIEGRDFIPGRYVLGSQSRTDWWMNIKSVLPLPIAPIESNKKIDANKRTQNSGDRDGNGRREQPEAEIKIKLNQQEFDDALKVLAETPGLKSNNLSIKVEVQDEVRVIMIVAPDGAVVRRLSEAQLWAATRDKDRQTGKFLDKAM